MTCPIRRFTCIPPSWSHRARPCNATRRCWHASQHSRAPKPRPRRSTEFAPPRKLVMSNVVQFLETLGASPSLSATGYANAVDALELDRAARDALIAQDADGLSRLLGGRAAMRCSIATPD